MNFRESPFSEMPLIRPQTFGNEIVFADGIGSSGKGMLSHLLSSLKRVEKQSNHYVFDYISYIHWLGKISTDAAVAYLQIEADVQMYHIMMSRDVNFRPSDSTGIWQNANRLQYLVRLFLSEGDPVVSRITQNRPILNEAPHDALRNANLFFDAFDQRLRIIYILRDPRELVLDWHRRGFGRRIGRDPREFQLTLLSNGSPIPFFLLGSNLEHSTLSDIEINVKMINFCLKENLIGYESLSSIRKQQVFLLPFDKLVSQPEHCLQSIADFLGTSVTKKAKRIFRRENLPRDLTNKEILQDQISSQIGADAIKELSDSVATYEKFISYTNYVW